MFFLKIFLVRVFLKIISFEEDTKVGVNDNYIMKDRYRVSLLDWSSITYKIRMIN